MEKVNTIFSVVGKLVLFVLLIGLVWAICSGPFILHFDNGEYSGASHIQAN